jgi:hypothetical protein
MRAAAGSGRMDEKIDSSSLFCVLLLYIAGVFQPYTPHGNRYKKWYQIIFGTIAKRLGSGADSIALSRI